MKYYFHRRPKSNVSLFVYCKDGRCEVTTGVRHDSELHKNRGYLCGSKPAILINEHIFEAVTRMEDLIHEYKKANSNDTPSKKELKRLFKGDEKPIPTLRSVMEKYVVDVKAGIVLKSNGHRIKQSTASHSVYGVNILMSKLSKDLLDTALGTTNLGTRSRAKKFGNSITAALVESGYQDATVDGLIGRVKASISWHDYINDDGMSAYINQMSYERGVKEPKMITKEESDYIINNQNEIRELCQSKNEKSSLDIWLCALELGQRVGDMKSFHQKNVYTMDGQSWIKFRQSKTQELIDLPVSQNLRNIFDRNAIKLDGKLLPHVSGVSQYMKQIASRLPIFQYEYRRELFHGGQLSYKTGQRWEFIHIHEMRGTCITNMLQAGVNEEVVKSFSGHTINSQDFSRYVKARPETKIDAMKKLINSSVACDKIKETKVISI